MQQRRQKPKKTMNGWLASMYVPASLTVAAYMPMPGKLCRSDEQTAVFETIYFSTAKPSSVMTN
jgi:hypothetical protein